MRLFTASVVILMTAFLVSRPAAAQDVVAGWQGDNTQGYAFVAPTARFPLSTSQSVLLRATVSFLYYNSEADGPTDVTAPGGAVAGGYRVTTPRVNVTVLAGFEQRRLRHGWERGASASTEMFVAATPLTQISALATFAQANRYTWARAGVKRQLTNTDFKGPRAVGVGIELTAQGNRDVTTYECGGVLEHAWMHTGTSIQFRAGYSRSMFPGGADRAKSYAGIGVYRRL